MAGPTQEPDPKFSEDFTINTVKNSTSNHQLEDSKNPQQVPIALSLKGPAFLRSRDTAYKVER